MRTHHHGDRDVGDVLTGDGGAQFVDLVAAAFGPLPGDVEPDCLGHVASLALKYNTVA